MENKSTINLSKIVKFLFRISVIVACVLFISGLFSLRPSPFVEEQFYPDPTHQIKGMYSHFVNIGGHRLMTVYEFNSYLLYIIPPFVILNCIILLLIVFNYGRKKLSSKKASKDKLRESIKYAALGLLGLLVIIIIGFFIFLLIDIQSSLDPLNFID